MVRKIAPVLVINSSFGHKLNERPIDDNPFADEGTRHDAIMMMVTSILGQLLLIKFIRIRH